MMTHAVLRILVVLLLLLMPAPAQASNTIVAFGDSVTVGCCVTNFPADSYIGIVESYTGTTVDNRAVSGSGIDDQVTRIRAYAGDASTVIWGLGYGWIRTRDNPQAYAESLVTGLDLLTSKPVYLGNSLRLNAAGYAFYGGDDATVDAFDVMEAQVAARYPNVILVDVASAYHPEWGEVAPDNIHPNEVGHRVIAWAFLPHLVPVWFFFPFVTY